MKLVLASSSPRRRDLLERIGVIPDRTVSPDIDETPRPGERPRLYAERMAVEKARAVARTGDGDGDGDGDEIVLAGDTTVAVGRCILPPADTPDRQREMLALLSGRRHHVHSAVAVIDATGGLRTRLSDSIVIFKPLHPAEIDAYVASGEGLGKAGGYAIQGRAEALVRWMSGSHSGVIGLPLHETRALLKAAGLPIG